MSATFESEGAGKAIELCEQLKSWDMYRATAAEEGVVTLREMMRRSAIRAINSELDEERKEAIRQALAEWDHPDFLLYLMVKVADYMEVC